VDDLILASLKNLKAINKAKKLLSSEFDIKNLKKYKNLLSMIISYNFNKIVTIS
jgi:hypothetical protein